MHLAWSAQPSADQAPSSAETAYTHNCRTIVARSYTHDHETARTQPRLKPAFGHAHGYDKANTLPRPKTRDWPRLKPAPAARPVSPQLGLNRSAPLCAVIMRWAVLILARLGYRCGTL